MRPHVTIYTKDYCPYCKAAKALLRAKGVSFTNHEITGDAAGRQVMIQRAGGRTTVPQVFIGATHLGGYTELAAADASGQLDKLLNAELT